MTREMLGSIPLQDLYQFAQRVGIPIDQDLQKEELIGVIIEEMDDEREGNYSGGTPTDSIEDKKYNFPVSHELVDEGDEELTLPDMYNENEVNLVLRDPYWVYSYWNIAKKLHNNLKNETGFVSLFLRVYELEEDDNPDLTLRNFDEDMRKAPIKELPLDVSSSFDIPVLLRDSSRYVNLPNANSYYFIDLCYLVEETEFFDETAIEDRLKLIARSNIIRSSGSGEVWHMLQEKGGLSPMLQLSDDDEDDGFGGARRGSQIPQRIIPIEDNQVIFE